LVRVINIFSANFELIDLEIYSPPQGGTRLSCIYGIRGTQSTFSFTLLTASGGFDPYTLSNCVANLHTESKHGGFFSCDYYPLSYDDLVAQGII